MGRGRPKKNKDEFTDLPEEFKAKALAQDETGLRQLISQSAMNELALREAKKEDRQLNECIAAKDSAEEQYKEGAKQNKLQIKYCRRLLSDKGVDVPCILDFVKLAKGE